ncbi:MAG: Ig-like domain-containing protein [Gammaproteobacteria bacterium]
MKDYIKPAAAAVALMLVAGPAAAADYWLAAKAYTKTLPDGSSVPMWGYVEDTGDGTNAHCYDITGGGSVALRNACVAALPDPVAPGPRLTVQPNETLFRIYLTNGLPEPTSIVVPGQEIPFSSNTVTGPTWNDGTTGPRTDPAQRVRSFGVETAANGGRRAYVWANSRGNPFVSPGTFIYHSGTHPQKQVYMGLYGAVTKDEVAEDIVTGTSAEAYPDVPYDNEVVLFYSDIDPAHNAAVAALDSTYTPIKYNAKWFLINGEPYEAGMADIPAGLASVPGTNTRSDTLIRFLSAASETHVPVLQGLRMTIHAEDGNPYTWQNGDTVGGTAPRTQYSALLPPLKTKDAIIQPTSEGRYAVYDGNGYMTNPSNIDDFAVGDTVGGMLRFLAVSDANLVPVAVNDTATTAEDTPVDIDVVLNDSDPDGNGLTVVSVTVPTSGTAVISNPDCCVLYTPNPDFNGMDQFDYTITDGNGVTSTATAFVDVTVTAVNDPPSITSTPVTTATTAVLYSYDVEATDVDLGDTPPDVLSFSLTLGPAGMTIDAATGLIEWTPTVQDNAASYDVTVVVTDSALAIDTQNYTIVNTLVNVAPTITTTPVTTATAGQAYSYDVDATDPDLGDTQTYSLDVSPAGMTIDAATGVIDWTPTMAQLGDNAVTVTVTDFNGLPAEQTYTVTVGAAAGALFFSTAGNATVPGVPDPSNNADIYAYDGAIYSRILDSGFSGNIDALYVVDADTFYVSFANNGGVTNGGLTLQDEDIGLYDAGTWTLYYDGSATGLGGTGTGYDIDAISIAGGVLYFSTVGNVNVGGLGAGDDADIYSHDGTAYARVFDASANGLPGNADIDGLTVQGTTYYMSFNRNGGTAVPGLGSVSDEAVVSFNGANWAVYFSGPGLTTNGHDVDAVHVP